MNVHDAKINRVMARTFRENGIHLRPAAAAAFKESIVKQLLLRQKIESMDEDFNTAPYVMDEINHTLSKLVSLLKQKNYSSSIIELETASNVVESFEAGVDDIKESQSIRSAKQGQYDPTYVEFFDAFSLPYQAYHANRKTYIPVSNTSNRPLLGDAQAKLSMAFDRYNLVRQRILRSSLAEYLTPIEGLLGLSGQQTVLGMLSEADDKVWQMEETNTVIQLDLSSVNPDPAAGYIDPVFFNEYSMALLNGEYLHGTMVASTVSSPPAEPRSATLRAMPGLAHFGQPHSLNLDRKIELGQKLLESERENDTIVFFSEIYLDDPEVMERLSSAFGQLSALDQPPVVIYLIGDFLSPTVVSYTLDNDPYALNSYFQRLSSLINEFPMLVENTMFVIVPGRNDGFSEPTLPSRGFPEYLTSGLQAKVKNIVFPSNPCRMLYYGVEFVTIRSNTSERLSAGALNPAGGAQDEKSLRLVKTVCDQAHLSPVHPLKQPVVWNFDYSLYLNPLPHVLILSENNLSYFDVVYTDCLCANPGSFSKTGSFLEVNPSKLSAKKWEISPISNYSNSI